MNLTYTQQNPTLMVAQWFIAMQELDFTVHFVKGSENKLADALSRLCSNLTEIALPMAITNCGDTSSSSSSLTSVAALRDIETPKDEQTAYIQCHNGADRTLTRLLSLNQVWKNMKQHVHSFIRNCPCCQKLSTIDAKIKVAHFSTLTHAIFDTSNINYVGPFSDKGYILFSRWTEML